MVATCSKINALADATPRFAVRAEVKRGSFSAVDGDLEVNRARALVLYRPQVRARAEVILPHFDPPLPVANSCYQPKVHKRIMKKMKPSSFVGVLRIKG